MSNCSYVLISNISKPAMSRTPINVDLEDGRSSARLMRSTSAPNDFSYKDLLKDASSSRDCCPVLA